MLLRRFGTTIGAVEPNFEPAAFNELSFVRRPGFQMSTAEFQTEYERIDELALTSEAEAHVKIQAEAALLDLLAHHINEAVHARPEGEVLLIESMPGKDYPRIHERTENLVEGDRNRLHFYYWLEPALRLGVYRRKSS
jgi:hypothetical protein